MRLDAVVVGAGVIGLTMGVCLAERGLKVRLRSREVPASTTSAVASAMIGPAVAAADDQAGVRERTGIKDFTALADVAGTGVALRRGRLASREHGPSLPSMQACAPGELPAGFAAGFWATLPLVDMPVYLSYLTNRLAAAGGEIEYGEVRSLSELTGTAPLVANCSGLGGLSLMQWSPHCVASMSSSTIPVLRSSSSRRPLARRGRRTGPTPTTSYSAVSLSAATKRSSPIVPSPRRSCAGASRWSTGWGRRGCAATRSGYVRCGRRCGSRPSSSAGHA